MEGGRQQGEIGALDEGMRGEDERDE